MLMIVNMVEVNVLDAYLGFEPNKFKAEGGGVVRKETMNRQKERMKKLKPSNVLLDSPTVFQYWSTTLPNDTFHIYFYFCFL